MVPNNETEMLGVEPGCPTHGDEHMRECSMCGAEFCRRCFPGAKVCPDCADSGPEEEEEVDFGDTRNIAEELEDEEESDKVIEDDESTRDLMDGREERF